MLKLLLITKTFKEAIKDADVDVVAFYIERGVDVNALLKRRRYEKEDDCYPLPLALEQVLKRVRSSADDKSKEERAMQVLELLVNAGADLNQVFFWKGVLHSHGVIERTALARTVDAFYTVSNHPLDELFPSCFSKTQDEAFLFKLVKLFLKKNDGASSKTMLTQMDEMASTPLHYAVKKKQLELAQLLIEKGADVNQQNKEGDTALHVACSVGFVEFIQEVSNNSLPCCFLKNEAGQYPLDLVAENGLHFAKSDKIILCLLECSASFNETSLIHVWHIANMTKNTELQEWFFKRQQIWLRSYRDERGQRLLHLNPPSCRVSALVALGLNPNDTENNNAISPLLAMINSIPYFINEESIALWHALVGRGANVKPNLPKGNTLFHMLLETSIGDVTALFDLLRQEGVSPMQPNAQGDTPLYYALCIQRGNKNIKSIAWLYQAGCRWLDKNNEGKYVVEMLPAIFDFTAEYWQEILQQIIDELKGKPNVYHDLPLSLLACLAASVGDLNFLGHLLQKDIDLNAPLPFQSLSVQLFSLREVVGCFRQIGCKAFSPFFVAVYYRQSAVMDLLMPMALEYSKQQGQLALWIAVYLLDVPLVMRLLEEARIDIAITDEKGNTMLHYLLQSIHPQQITKQLSSLQVVVARLMDSSRLSEKKNNNGETAFDVLMARRDVPQCWPLIKLCLRHMPSVQLPTKIVPFLFQYALRSDNKMMTQEFLQCSEVKFELFYLSLVQHCFNQMRPDYIAFRDFMAHYAKPDDKSLFREIIMMRSKTNEIVRVLDSLDACSSDPKQLEAAEDILCNLIEDGHSFPESGLAFKNASHSPYWHSMPLLHVAACWQFKRLVACVASRQTDPQLPFLKIKTDKKKPLLNALEIAVDNDNPAILKIIHEYYPETKSNFLVRRACTMRSVHVLDYFITLGYDVTSSKPDLLPPSYASYFPLSEYIPLDLWIFTQNLPSDRPQVEPSQVMLKANADITLERALLYIKHASRFAYSSAFWTWLLEAIPNAEQSFSQLFNVAVSANNNFIFQRLLEHSSASEFLNARKVMEATPLMDMVRYSGDKMLELIKPYLADSKVQSTQDERGYTVTHYALFYDRFEMLPLSWNFSFEKEAFSELNFWLFNWSEGHNDFCFYSMDNHQQREMAYKLLVVFSTAEAAIAYIEKYLVLLEPPKERVFALQDNPLVELCRFELPLSDQWDRASWAELAMAHGSALTKHLPRAAEIQVQLNPVPNDLDVIEFLAQRLSYARADENPELARLFLRYGFPEATFHDVLTYYTPKEDDNIPDLSIDGHTLGEALDPKWHGYTLKKLAKDDPRGFILGKLTACCQHMMGPGYGCAWHGMTQPNGGFYVIINQKKSEKEAARYEKILGMIEASESIDDFIQQKLKDKSQRKSYREKINNIKVMWEKAYDHVPSDNDCLCELKREIEQKLAEMEDDLIVAQSWAWLSPQGLVFDSWERRRPEMNACCEPFLKAFAKQFLASDHAALHGINKVMLGQSGMTPKDLSFDVAETPEIPKDYVGYRDSMTQYVVSSQQPLSIREKPAQEKEPECISAPSENTLFNAEAESIYLSLKWFALTQQSMRIRVIEPAHIREKEGAIEGYVDPYGYVGVNWCALLDAVETIPDDPALFYFYPVCFNNRWSCLILRADATNSKTLILDVLDASLALEGALSAFFKTGFSSLTSETSLIVRSTGAEYCTSPDLTDAWLLAVLNSYFQKDSSKGCFIKEADLEKEKEYWRKITSGILQSLTKKNPEKVLSFEEVDKALEVRIGETPLLMAMERGYLSLAALLLEAGCDLLSPSTWPYSNLRGYSPIEAVFRLDDSEIKQPLLDLLLKALNNRGGYGFNNRLKPQDRLLFEEIYNCDWVSDDTLVRYLDDYSFNLTMKVSMFFPQKGKQDVTLLERIICSYRGKLRPEPVYLKMFECAEGALHLCDSQALLRTMAWNGYIDAMNYLYERNKISLEGDVGAEIISVSLRSFNPKVARWLLTHGASMPEMMKGASGCNEPTFNVIVEVISEDYGRSSAAEPILECYQDIFDLLLESSLEVNKPNSQGVLPLDCLVFAFSHASEEHHSTLGKLLLKLVNRYSMNHLVNNYNWQRNNLHSFLLALLELKRHDLIKEIVQSIDEPLSEVAHLIESWWTIDDDGSLRVQIFSYLFSMVSHRDRSVETQRFIMVLLFEHGLSPLSDYKLDYQQKLISLFSHAWSRGEREIAKLIFNKILSTDNRLSIDDLCLLALSDELQLLTVVFKQFPFDEFARNEQDLIFAHALITERRRRRSTAVLQHLLDSGFKPSKTIVYGRESHLLLHYAMTHYSSTVFQQLLDPKYQLDLEVKNNYKETVLERAVLSLLSARKDTAPVVPNELVRSLVTKGADCCGLLHQIVKANLHTPCRSLADYLIKEGNANVNETNNDGNTPLGLAMLYECEEMVSFLLAYDLDVDVHLQEYLSGDEYNQEAYLSCLKEHQNKAEFVGSLLEAIESRVEARESDTDLPMPASTTLFFESSVGEPRAASHDSRPAP